MPMIPTPITAPLAEKSSATTIRSIMKIANEVPFLQVITKGSAKDANAYPHAMAFDATKYLSV